MSTCHHYLSKFGSFKIEYENIRCPYCELLEEYNDLLEELDNLKLEFELLEEDTY